MRLSSTLKNRLQHQLSQTIPRPQNETATAPNSSKTRLAPGLRHRDPINVLPRGLADLTPERIDLGATVALVGLGTHQRANHHADKVDR
jgi:hypothetical protein